MLSGLQVVSLLIATSRVIGGVHAASSNRTGSNPVSCDAIAFGVGDLTISSVRDTSVQFDVLQSGPAKDILGHPFLEHGTDPDFPLVVFQTCNSSYMNWNSFQFDANQTHVEFYGHVALQGAEVGQPAIAACLQRNQDGTVVWAACTYKEGPSQIAQYWKMVKLQSDPTKPAPIDFPGYANGTNPGFVYSPSYVSFKGSKIVKEPAAAASTQPKYQLFFSMRE